MKYDLLPCPFCGSRNVEMTGVIMFFVVCRDCKSEGPVAFTTTGGIREAASLWNTRRDTEPDTDE